MSERLAREERRRKRLRCLMQGTRNSPVPLFQPGQWLEILGSKKPAEGRVMTCRREEHGGWVYYLRGPMSDLWVMPEKRLRGVASFDEMMQKLKTGGAE